MGKKSLGLNFNATLFVLIFARTKFRAFTQKFLLVREIKYMYYAQNVLPEIKYARNLTNYFQKTIP